MASSTRRTMAIVAVLALVIAAAWLVQGRQHLFLASGESGAKVWFYDLHQQQLYAAPRDTIPPDRAGRGGVRAVVVAFRGEEQEPGKRRIAYLETYGQPLKEALERLKRARHSGTLVTEPPPERGSEVFRANDLVRKLEEAEWHAATSPEGQRIMSEWRSWRGPGGQAPGICLP